MAHRGGLSLSNIIWRIGRGRSSFLLPWGPTILLAVLGNHVAQSSNSMQCIVGHCLFSSFLLLAITMSVLPISNNCRYYHFGIFNLFRFMPLIQKSKYQFLLKLYPILYVIRDLHREHGPVSL